MIIPAGFAYVEPKTAPTTPILDDLTRKATALWRSCSPSKGGYRGSHACTGANCAATRDNKDYFLPDGRKTHSLLVHYVACHRSAVPKSDLAYIDNLAEEDQPTNSELSGTWAPSSARPQFSTSAPEPAKKAPWQLQRDIDQALASKPKNVPRTKIIDSFEDPENDLIYEVSIDNSELPGDPGRFVVTARYLSDGQEFPAMPLRFASREQAISTARTLAQKTVYRPAQRRR